MPTIVYKFIGYIETKLFSIVMNIKCFAILVSQMKILSPRYTYCLESFTKIDLNNF